MSYRAAVARLVRNIIQDLKFGGFLGGVKRSPFAALGAYDTANSDYEALRCLFMPLRERLDRHSCLVDVGCGKGRVLNFWLKEFPHKEIYGVELDAAIAGDVAKRLRGFPNLHVLTGNACENIPVDATFFYLFNPFDARVLADFIVKLRASTQAIAGKKIELLYYNPVHIDVFNGSSVASIERLPVRPGFHEAAYIRLN